MCLPFSRLNSNWMMTEMRLKSTFPVTIQSPFSHHSVTIQSTERWDFILCPFWQPLSRSRWRCTVSAVLWPHPSSRVFWLGWLGLSKMCHFFLQGQHLSCDTLKNCCCLIFSGWKWMYVCSPSFRASFVLPTNDPRESLEIPGLDVGLEKTVQINKHIWLYHNVD